MYKNITEANNKSVFWEVLESRDIFIVESRLAVAVQRLRLPNGKIINDYYQIRFPEAVIMVARTAKGKIVMSRQYMHGFKKVSLVLPAGTMEKGESPLETAQRELLEETGYSAQGWQLLASLSPHTNYGCGKLHFFFADNANQVTNPKAVDFEEMEIVLMDERQIIDAIRKSDIISVGTITALTLAKVILSDKLF